MKATLSRDAIRSTADWLDQNKSSLVRIGAVAFILAASLYLAPRAALGHRNPLLLISAAFAVAGLALVLRWPTLGIMACLAGGIFVSYSWQGGFNLSQIGLVLMLGVWLFDAVLIRKKLQLAQSRTMRPLLAFIAVSILSFCLGQFSWYPFARNAPIEAQLGGLAINLISAGAFLLVAHLVDDTRKLAWLTWVFIALGSIYIVVRVLKQGWIDDIYQAGFTEGSLFWTWLVALPAGQAVANRHLPKPIRLLFGAIVVLTFYVALTQAYDWKSGWFPPLVAIAVICLVRYWRKLRYLTPLAVIVLYILATNSIGLEDWSWSTRLDAWLIVINIAKVSPILGMGFANYYWYTPLFPIRGFAVVFNSHSQFVDLIAEIGLVGLFCFVWFFGEVGWLSWKMVKSAPEGFASGYVYGVLGGVAGTIVAAYLVDWVLPFVYNIGLTGFRASVLAWLFMGGLVSIEQMVRRKA